MKIKKNTYIPYRLLPTKMPLFSTIAWITILNYWKAPEWLYGVFGILMLITWINFAYWFFKSEEIDAKHFE